MTSPILTHAAGQTSPSREFLVRQACLNALLTEQPALCAWPSFVANYARGRFAYSLASGCGEWEGVTDIVGAIRSEFRTLASRYTQSDAIMGEGK